MPILAGELGIHVARVRQRVAHRLGAMGKAVVDTFGAQFREARAEPLAEYLCVAHCRRAATAILSRASTIRKIDDF